MCYSRHRDLSIDFYLPGGLLAYGKATQTVYVCRHLKFEARIDFA